MRKRLAAIVLLMLAVCALPVMAQANEEVKYIDFVSSNGQYVMENGALVKVDKSVTEYATVGNATGNVTWSDGNEKWYVVSDNVTIEGRITVKGIVNLILTDKATLTAEKGITVHNGNLLTIYAQSEVGDTMGRIVIDGSRQNQAGIGGYGTSASTKICGNVTINGGKIDFSLQTKDKVNNSNSAGIGGSYGAAAAQSRSMAA